MILVAVLDVISRIKGFVTVSAEGSFTERFINICTRRGIMLRNVKRPGSEKIIADMDIADFRRIAPIARKSKTRVRIIRRCGLPFLLHRYRHRKAAVFGIAVFFVILWYLSSHVMGIEVTGNERLSTSVIISELGECGVRYGAGIKGLDSRKIQNRMMTRLDDIAWIGINIKGSRLYVEVKERLDTRVGMEKELPCNLIAARDGVVRLMDVKAGQNTVKVGEAVAKGDLLVSGAVDSVTHGIRYVHSFGEVYADTIYRQSGDYSVVYEEKIYTGAEKIFYSAEIFGKKIKFFKSGEKPFANCDKTEEVKEYRLPADILPSLFVRCEKYSEYMPKAKRRSVEETVETAKAQLCERLNGEIPPDAKIKNINVVHNIKDDKTVTVTVEYECFENIALQTPIDKIENMDYDIIDKES